VHPVHAASLCPIGPHQPTHCSAGIQKATHRSNYLLICSHCHQSAGFKKPGFFLKAQPSGFYWVLGFFGQAGKNR